ncbi:hypothetical protein BP6252_10390 [Coleophoma cylindrospora]|uniref:Uncharacterized protein n=1 Tax=Coleophoma cylindrospora TaxID=1849047 RepID=A0A3D8QSE7_9HELO|nr:hypothetical protein BP6252_10390 [Coleophoma cylindrospora]
MSPPVTPRWVDDDADTLVGNSQSSSSVFGGGWVEDDDDLFPPTPEAIRHSRMRYNWNQQDIQRANRRIDSLEETVRHCGHFIERLLDEVHILKANSHTSRDVKQNKQTMQERKEEVNLEMQAMMSKEREGSINIEKHNNLTATETDEDSEDLYNASPLQNRSRASQASMEIFPASPHSTLSDLIKRKSDLVLKTPPALIEPQLLRYPSPNLGEGGSAAMDDALGRHLGDVGLQTLEELLESETASNSPSTSITEVDDETTKADDKPTAEEFMRSEEDRIAAARALIASANFIEPKPPIIIDTGFATHEEIDRRLAGNFTGAPREDEDDMTTSFHRRIVHRSNSPIPDVVKFGINYEPNSVETNNFRGILITNIPKEIKLRDVLFKVRGGEILKAVMVDTQFLRNDAGMPFNSVLVTFLKQRNAEAYVEFARANPVCFSSTSEHGKVNSWSAVVKLIDTPTYPSTSAVTNILRLGQSRHITISNIPPEFNLEGLLYDLSARNSRRQETILDMYWTTIPIAYPTVNTPRAQAMQSKEAAPEEEIAINSEQSSPEVETPIITNEPSAVHEITIKPQQDSLIQTMAVLHVEFSSIDMAGDCYKILTRFRDYRNLVVKFADDPCAGPLEQISSSLAKRENLLQTELMPCKKASTIQDVIEDTERNFREDGFRKPPVGLASSMFMRAPEQTAMLLDLSGGFHNIFGPGSAVNDLAGLAPGHASDAISSGSAVNDLIGLVVGLSNEIRNPDEIEIDLSDLE